MTFVATPSFPKDNPSQEEKLTSFLWLGLGVKL